MYVSEGEEWKIDGIEGRTTIRITMPWFEFEVSEF
jgi:hypothetical protein